MNGSETITTSSINARTLAQMALHDFELVKMEWSSHYTLLCMLLKPRI